MNIAARHSENAQFHPPLPTRLVIGVRGPSAAKNLYRDFVDLAAEQVLSALEDLRGAVVVLNAHMPPWSGHSIPQGYLVLELVTEKQNACCIGIAFGLEGGSKRPVRNGFDFARFAKHPEDPQSAGLVVASFDECWLLVCKLLEGLMPSSVRFSFGA